MTSNPPIRLLSLDVFRGLTVAMMILVNNPGDWGRIYLPLEHAEWNGCTPTDLVFPFFLFIVGVSVSYALGKKKELTGNHNKLILVSLKRALIIFGLGLFMSLFPKVFTDPVSSFATVRIPGVLQRIALVYFVTAVLFIKTGPKTQLRVLVAVLIAYWALMTFVPVPGVGYPNLEKETNLGAWLDRTLITSPHLWKSAVTWDPEGLLSSMPAVSTGLFGVLTGTWLKRKDRDEATKVTWLFVTGIFAVMLGLLWDLQFPINKSLWTSSYVLYSGGLAMMGLALLYWIVDVQGYKKWTTAFVVYGVNAIVVFVASGLLARSMNLYMVQAEGKEVSFKTWLYSSYFVPHFSPINASLAWAITNILFWLGILWWMYSKKIIIKV
ncbi:acyltransferase family protein [Hufsiella ginkgonis]|uniref:DUF1624 domain-containing protein n=1 Tax=Hufsiella ginkgonis TaxID=2695274 RepID=A0A7K1XUI4_9SPHI|nr:heparan-alpha-glucosaminide N-acetyltransferase domain-containing protein [Hufsiella ginkgonis]MXV14642.1 DUF1624 domain-containing protein [Hufsiella ginkgonis]